VSSLHKPLLLDIPFDNWDWDEVPKYRREQVRKWVFEKGFLDWDKMSNLPKSLKDRFIRTGGFISHGARKSSGFE
jgi:hypothetical protein